MAWEWTSPLVTGLVGMAGIGGTYFTVHAQRKSQIQVMMRQQEYQEERENDTARRATFMGFLNSYQRYVEHATTVRARRAGAMTMGGDPSRVSIGELNNALSDLFDARNQLQFVATAYTLYYADQMMDDLNSVVDAAQRGQTGSIEKPLAVHLIRYLMNEELRNAELMSRQPGDVLADIAKHAAKLRAIDAALKGRTATLTGHDINESIAGRGIIGPIGS